MIEPNNTNIRKIIDPKSGFTLYIKKSEESSIPMVSTLSSFGLPVEPSNNQSQIEFEKKLNELKKSQISATKSTESAILKLEEKNKQLSILIFCLSICIITSIFF